MLVTAEIAIRHIRHRLMADWVLIDGDQSMIAELERQVYLPGEKNKDFEIVVTFSERGTRPVCLGRKTEDLRRALKLARDDEWRSILVVSLDSMVDKGHALIHIGGPRPGHSRADAVDAFVMDLL